MVLMSSIGLYLLEYMIPFSRNVKGIENASKAYYQSYGWIEDALLYSYSGWVGYETTNTLSGSIDYWYRMEAITTTFPAPWLWDSPFDLDWNTISQARWIQLSIGNNRLFSWPNRFNIKFRVPDFNRNATVDALDTSPNDDIILWQLSSSINSISSRDGALITENDVDGNYINFWTTSWVGRWVYRDWSPGNFFNFYNSECWVWSECVLKISVINPLEWSGGNQYPFLEYHIYTSQDIPSQFRQIQVVGQSLNFKKTLNISVLQQNTNAAFDFAIIQ